MCLAIPARIVEIQDGDRATVNLGGVKVPVSLALVEDVAVGDYVIIHTGYALSRLDPGEAARTLALMAEGGIVPVPQDTAQDTAQDTGARDIGP